MPEVNLHVGDIFWHPHCPARVGYIYKITKNLIHYKFYPDGGVGFSSPTLFKERLEGQRYIVQHATKNDKGQSG